MTRKSVGRNVTQKLQRFRCLTCSCCWTQQRTTTRNRWSQRLIKQTVRSFVQGTSLRDLGRNLDVSWVTIHNWVIEYGEKVEDPVKIARKLNLSHWTGILFLDGKWISKNLVLLLAVDFGTLDAVAWLVCTCESEANYQRLIDLAKDCGYSIKAIISDGNSAIVALTQPKEVTSRKGTRRFPRPGVTPKLIQNRKLDVPHQWCVVHAQRSIRTLTRYCSKDDRVWIEQRANLILFARTPKNAKKYLQKLLWHMDLLNRCHKNVANFLLRNWDMLMIHHRVRINMRRIPRDTNGIENSISYLNKRFKTMKGLKTQKTARSIVSLIVFNYRKKPLDCTKNKLKKGKSPLQLAGAKNLQNERLGMW